LSSATEHSLEIHGYIQFRIHSSIKYTKSELIHTCRTAWDGVTSTPGGEPRSSEDVCNRILVIGKKAKLVVELVLQFQFWVPNLIKMLTYSTLLAPFHIWNPINSLFRVRGDLRDT
jgi:hypothetical protein